MEVELNVEKLRENIRTDGRKKGELREIRFEKDSSYRADGSATVSHGITHIQCIIYRKDVCYDKCLRSYQLCHQLLGIHGLGKYHCENCIFR